VDLMVVVLIKEDGDLMEVIKDLIQGLIQDLIREVQLIQTVECVMVQENVLLATVLDVMVPVLLWYQILPKFVKDAMEMVLNLLIFVQYVEDVDGRIDNIHHLIIQIL
jgi:hypothetical protein